MSKITRNMSHQLIKNSSQCSHFNNSSGNVSILQLHCCMSYFLLSFDFCCTFRAHIPQLGLELFLLDQMQMKIIQLENSQAQANCFHLTISCSPMVLDTLIRLSWIICWLEDNRMESINQSTEHKVLSHWKSVNSFDIFFFRHHTVPYHCASIIAAFFNTEWLK